MIPVAVLAQALERRGGEAVMVTYDAVQAAFYRKQGLRRQVHAPSGATIDPDGMLALLERVDPAVTICDWRRDFWCAVIARPPRCSVSVLRCEQVLGYRRLSRTLRNKFPARWDGWRWLEARGVTAPRLVRALYRADLIVLPSIPEVDPVPTSVRPQYAGTRFLYSGPLVLEEPGLAPRLRRWVDARRREGRAVVVVTLGTVWGQGVVAPLIDHLRTQEFASIVTVPDEALRRRLPASGDDVLVVGFVGLRALIAEADAVVHHCGHGTALLTLEAAKPSLTLPTSEYDRADNALRLERLGCSRRVRARALLDGIDLGASIKRLLSDRGARRSAARLSRQVRSTVGADGVADAVFERLGHR